MSDPLIVGIQTGGAWVAEHLHAELGLSEPLGHLDISFYRDDFTRLRLDPEVGASELPFDVTDRPVILVDDVLYTGRTVRAALNELFDYGRPAYVLLVVMVERDGRELPIQPDIAGISLSLADDEQIELTGPEPLQLLLTQRGSEAGP